MAEQTTLRTKTKGLLNDLRKEASKQNPSMSLNRYIECILLDREVSGYKTIEQLIDRKAKDK